MLSSFRVAVGNPLGGGACTEFVVGLAHAKSVCVGVVGKAVQPLAASTDLLMPCPDFCVFATVNTMAGPWCFFCS